MNKTLITAFAALTLSGSAFASMMDSPTQSDCLAMTMGAVSFMVDKSSMSAMGGDKDMSTMLQKMGLDKGSRKFNDMPMAKGLPMTTSAVQKCKNMLGDMKISDHSSSSNASATREMLGKFDDVNLKNVAKLEKTMKMMDSDNMSKFMTMKVK